MTRLLAAIRRRPIRVMEALTAVFGLLAAFGLDLDGDQQAAILTLAALLVGAGEVAQTQTTPLADPHDADGRPLAPVNLPPVERYAD